MVGHNVIDLQELVEEPHFGQSILTVFYQFPHFAADLLFLLVHLQLDLLVKTLDLLKLRKLVVRLFPDIDLLLVLVEGAVLLVQILLHGLEQTLLFVVKEVLVFENVVVSVYIEVLVVVLEQLEFVGQYFVVDFVFSQFCFW